MKETGKLTGRHVLFMLIAFFGAMIAANVAFISAAVTSFPGVTDEQAYEKGLKYNETLAARAEQAALGWRAEVIEVAREGDTGVIVLKLANGDSALARLAVTGVLKRPASDDADQPLVFRYAGDGLYEAKVDVFPPGAWDLTARAEGNLGQVFDMEARIVAE